MGQSVGQMSALWPGVTAVPKGVASQLRTGGQGGSGISLTNSCLHFHGESSDGMPGRQGLAAGSAIRGGLMSCWAVWRAAGLCGLQPGQMHADCPDVSALEPR